MAMKAIRCTQCGADLELDDSRDFGFCSSCGTKVMLHETVKHSGEVHMKLDNSDQGKNRITLGNRAFDSGNWDEAYEYYKKGLEDVPKDALAIFRKGVCAVYMSPEENLRLSEFAAGFNDAWDIWDERSEAFEATDKSDTNEKNELGAIAKQIHIDVIDMLEHFEEANETYYPQLSDIEDCHQQAARWCEVARLYEMCAKGLPDPETVEAILEDGIDFCDRVMARKVKYYSHTTRDKNGNAKDHYSAYNLDSGRAQIIRNARAEMAEKFNNLPSRLEHSAELNRSLDELKEETLKLEEAMDEASEKYLAAKNEFWTNNPELSARRSKCQNMPWISVGVGLVLLIVSFFLKKISFIFPILGVALFVVSFIVRSKLSYSLVAKLEDDVFPADVKALGEEYQEAFGVYYDKDRERREKQAEISAFEATNK